MINIERTIEVLEEIYPSQKEIVTGEYPEVADSLDFSILALKKQKELLEYLEWLQEYGEYVETIKINDVTHKLRNLIIWD